MNQTFNAICKSTATLAMLALVSASADTAYFQLNNVFLDDGTQMQGVFSWVSEPDDFQNGVGSFESLSIPHTVHDHTDLGSTIEIEQSIEITLPNSTHDDGVDVTLKFSPPLTPTTSTSIDEYGSVSPPEFFAVATESFFEKSRSMKRKLPDLYQQLESYYQLDPASWKNPR